MMLRADGGPRRTDGMDAPYERVLYFVTSDGIVAALVVQRS
jgi:hypothetical protein